MLDLTEDLNELCNEYRITLFEETEFTRDTRVASNGKDGYALTYQAYKTTDPSFNVMIKRFQRVVNSRILGIYTKDREIVEKKLFKYFKRECRIWNRAGEEHPNISKFLGVIKLSDNQIPAFVLELCSGGTLYKFIVDGRARSTEPDQRIKLLVDVAEGLHFLHKRNVIHRDLKTSNILLDQTAGGALKALLSDFGCAKDLEGLIEFDNSTNVSSLKYCSPEQILNHGEVEAAKDIWSFGCVTLELMRCAIGIWPTQFTTEGIVQTLARGEHPPRPIEIDEEDIIWKFIESCCWCRDPSKRLTAREAVNALNEIGRSGNASV